MDTVYILTFSTYHNETRKYMGTASSVKHFVAERCAENDIDGCTLTVSEGMWKGEWEHSFVLTIVGDSSMRRSVEYVAEAIRIYYLQDAVLLTTHAVEAELL